MKQYFDENYFSYYKYNSISLRTFWSSGLFGNEENYNNKWHKIQMDYWDTLEPQVGNIVSN